MKLSCLALAVVFALPMVGAAKADAALVMRDNCRQILDAQREADDILMPRTFEAGACWGGFSSLQGLMSLQFEGVDHPMLSICPPPEATRTQLVEIFVSYASQHPEIGHEH